MNIVFALVLVLHLLGMAGVVGGWLSTVRAPRVLPIMWHGAFTSVITGIILVALTYARGEGDEIDNAKITVKLLVGLTVAVLAFVNRKRADVPANLVTLIGLMGVGNVCVAVLWA